MENDTTVTIKYSEFVSGVRAIAELEAIKRIIECGGIYCPKDVKVLLGIKVDED